MRLSILAWLIWVPLLWWQFRGAPSVLDWMAVRGWIRPSWVVGAPRHRDFLVMSAIYLLPWAMLLSLLAV